MFSRTVCNIKEIIRESDQVLYNYISLICCTRVPQDYIITEDFLMLKTKIDSGKQRIILRGAKGCGKSVGLVHEH